MLRYQHHSRLLLTIIIILTTSFRHINPQEICTELSTLRSSNTNTALFNIIGVLPISVDHPSELYPDGVLWAQMMHFMVTEYNKRHPSYTPHPIRILIHIQRILLTLQDYNDRFYQPSNAQGHSYVRLVILIGINREQ